MSDYPIVDLSTDALLTTTRSVRKRLDLTKPVPIGLIRECLEIAVQAPTSANVQNWGFIVVADVERRGEFSRRATMDGDHEGAGAQSSSRVERPPQ